jgi:Na+/H+ antiporter NhaA
VLLVIVTVVALAWANSPLSDAYFALWHLDVGFDFGPLGLHMDLHHWVNDGLMVVFFFLIGLEVRQEFAHGSLRDRSRARLALIAGVAGVVLPALVYVLIVGLAGGEGLHGWGRWSAPIRHSCWAPWRSSVRGYPVSCACSCSP